MLAGLDRLSQGIIAANPQVGFRCNISRTQHQLDFNPTVTSIMAYARLLQAEMETLALSAVDPNTEETPKLTKKQRAAALRKEQSSAPGKKAAAKGGTSDAGHAGGDNAQASSTAAGRGGQGGGKSNPDGNNGGGGKGGGLKGPCRFYSNKGGCKMGGACWSYHDFGKASSESRGFNCGALDHRADACTRPKDRRAGKGEESTPRGESGSGGSGTGTANAGGKGNAGHPTGDQKGTQVRQVTAGEASGSSGVLQERVFKLRSCSGRRAWGLRGPRRLRSRTVGWR